MPSVGTVSSTTLMSSWEAPGGTCTPITPSAVLTVRPAEPLPLALTLSMGLGGAPIVKLSAAVGMPVMMGSDWATTSVRSSMEITMVVPGTAVSRRSSVIRSCAGRNQSISRLALSWAAPPRKSLESSSRSAPSTAPVPLTSCQRRRPAPPMSLSLLAPVRRTMNVSRRRCPLETVVVRRRMGTFVLPAGTFAGPRLRPANVI